MSLLADREPHIKTLIDEIDIKRVEDKDFACAAISVADCNVILYINEKKFNLLFSDEKLAVLAHEIGHLALGHLSQRSFPEEDRFIVSLAQDISLNCGIKTSYKLPEWFVTAEKLGLPPNRSTSQYIPILTKIGKHNLMKLVKIPDISVKSNATQNKRLIKSIVDKIRVNPHLAININNDNVSCRTL